ncbi:MAG: ROK family protein [Corynebacterium sp.]|nr:ROK family protein [Corynebacterium sp.]
MTQIGFGIDIGGSGIKGARVNLETGEFIGDRIKILTPQPATPEAVAETVAEIVRQAEWTGPLGITMPSVIKAQTALTAANIDPSWVGIDVQKLFHTYVSPLIGEEYDITVLNDADAAGLAEVQYGVPEAKEGAVLMLTLGTGIGSALLNDGVLFPNTEFGHVELDGLVAEKYAASSIKDKEELSYSQWAKRVTKVFNFYEKILNPRVIVVGGGISRKADKWIPKLEVQTPVIPAQLRNTAGIVGAALAVAQGLRP